MIRIDRPGAPARWALLAAGLLVVSACGGSDTADAGLESSTDTTVAQQAADETTTTTAAAETTTTAAAADSSGYCTLAVEADVMADEFQAFDDPVALEAFLTERLELLDAAVAVVPAAIADDFAVLADAQRRLAQAAADGGYDFDVLLTEGVTIMETPEVNAARVSVDTYDVEICGTTSDEVAAGGDPASGPDDVDMELIESLLQTEAGRQAFAEGITQGTELTIEQALCIVENGDMMGLLAVGEGAGQVDGEMLSALLDTLEVCDIPVSAINN